MDNSFTPSLNFKSHHLIKTTYDKKILLLNYPHTNSDLLKLKEDGSIDEDFKLDADILHVNDCEVQDEKYIITTCYYTHDHMPVTEIHRIFSDGSIDPSFNDTNLHGITYEMTLTEEGKILVFINDEQTVKVVRLHTNGTVDETFRTKTGFDNRFNSISSIKIQPDGKIIVCGDFSRFDGQETGRIIRLNEDGSLDNSFVIPGPTTNIFDHGVHSLHILPSGKILVSGISSFYEDNHLQYESKLIRLNSDGALDTSFSIRRLGFKSISYGVSKLTNYEDNVYVAGAFLQFEDQNREGIALIDSDGNLMEHFNPTVGGPPEIKKAIQLNDGAIVLAGNLIGINGMSVNGLVKINKEGNIDTLFANNVGTGADLNIFNLAKQQDEKILVVGNFRTFNGLKNAGITRIHPNGVTDDSFALDYYSFSLREIKHIALFSNQQILLGSNYSLAKLNTDGSINNSFDPNIRYGSELKEFVLYDDKIIIASQEWTDTGRNSFIYRSDSMGNFDDSFNLVKFSDHAIYRFSLAKEKILSVGYSNSQFGDDHINPIFQINQNGQITDQYSLGTNGYGSINSLISTSDTTYIFGGSFSKINKFERHGLAKADLKGRVYSDFRYDVDGHINGIVQENEDQILVYGSFNQINGTSGFSGIARINFNTPRTPLDLSVSVDEARGIILTWKDSSDFETGYRIYRSSANSAGYTVIDSVGANTTRYVDTDINAAASYQYKVVSLRDTLQSDFSNQVSITTSGFSKPRAPENFILEAQNEAVYLSWMQGSSHVIGYIVERSTGEGFVAVDTVEATSYYDNGLVLDTQYQYRVKAYNVAGESDYTPVAQYLYEDKIMGIDTGLMKDAVAYPNPSADIFTIDISHKVNKEDIKLVDLNQKRIDLPNVRYEGNHLIVDLSGQSKGFYILSVTSDQETLTYRLIKN